LQRLHVIPKRCVGGRRAASYTTGKTTRGGAGLPEGQMFAIWQLSKVLRCKRQHIVDLVETSQLVALYLPGANNSRSCVRVPRASVIVFLEARQNVSES